MIDTLALLAIGAFGWGLSLLTYRFIALQYGWPMGMLQSELPQVPVILGLVALIAALFFAAMRGTADGGLVIILFGVMLSLFWTGFLRVGAQTSLVLAPLAAAFLLLGFLSGTPYDYRKLGGYGIDLGVQQPAEIYDRYERDRRRGE